MSDDSWINRRACTTYIVLLQFSVNCNQTNILAPLLSLLVVSDMKVNISAVKCLNSWSVRSSECSIFELRQVRMKLLMERVYEYKSVLWGKGTRMERSYVLMCILAPSMWAKHVVKEASNFKSSSMVALINEYAQYTYYGQIRC
jgi:hypothetical protein